MNRSDEPIFDVTVSGARKTGVDWTKAVIPPSSESSFVVHAVDEWDGDSARQGTIEFTDARGKRWVRLGAELRRAARR